MTVSTRVRSVALACALLVATLGLPAATATAQAVDILPIGTLQGPVPDGADGLVSRSPYAPPTGNGAGAETVTVQAIITQRTLTGSGQNGLFVQNTLDTADADPTTSDGIFVFIGRFTTLRVEGGGFYTPVLGDEVVLRGRVNEFFNLTQLSNPFVVGVVRSGVDLEAETPAFAVDPPDDLDDANRYWERHEGEQGRVPSGSVVIDARDVFGDIAAGADGEVWVARGDSEIAQRADPYARRAFRDPHPLDNVPGELFDDGNGYRILLGSLGLKATAPETGTAIIAPARTYDTVTSAPAGGLYFAFGKYQIQPSEQIALTPGVDPAENAPPEPAVDGEEYATAVYNVENLYDFRDDPFDGCDFAGNAGCTGVRPPFDYVPASEADYREQLEGIAAQIVDDLGAPAILAVQEAEDQDICDVTGGALTCGTADDADGRPDTLQELALVIAEQGGPVYDAAYDRDGADDRGIVAAFLYRTDLVELAPADSADPVLGSTPTVAYRGESAAANADVSNPKALNAALPEDVDTSTGTDGGDVFTRAPQVARFRVWRTAVGESVFTDLYAISNHFSSGPDGRIGQRTEQAAYNAAIVAALQAADPEVRVVTGGDLNVYPRPDDPLAPGDDGFPSDQLGPLYEQGLTNLYDSLLAEVPVSAYNYGFQGQAQTLDQQFVSPPLLSEFVELRVAHINADWPAEFVADGARGVSDHDPVVARFTAGPTIARLSALVDAYAEAGAVEPGAADALQSVLDRAAALADEGRPLAARLALLRFRLLTRGLADQIDPAAASVLRREASLIRP